MDFLFTHAILSPIVKVSYRCNSFFLLPYLLWEQQVVEHLSAEVKHDVIIRQPKRFQERFHSADLRQIVLRLHMR